MLNSSVIACDSIWQLEPDTCSQHVIQGFLPDPVLGVENTEQNQLFSSKMPSVVCGAGGGGRRAGIAETTHAVRSQACGKAFTWLFAAMALPLFSRKFLIPLFCHRQHRTGCCPHSVHLLHAGLSGSFASALSVSFLRTHTLVWLCLLKHGTT